MDAKTQAYKVPVKDCGLPGSVPGQEYDFPLVFDGLGEGSLLGVMPFSPLEQRQPAQGNLCVCIGYRWIGFLAQ
jgi:hypothetical protein